MVGGSSKVQLPKGKTPPCAQTWEGDGTNIFSLSYLEKKETNFGEERSLNGKIITQDNKVWELERIQVFLWLYSTYNRPTLIYDHVL